MRRAHNGRQPGCRRILWPSSPGNVLLIQTTRLSQSGEVLRIDDCALVDRMRLSLIHTILLSACVIHSIAAFENCENCSFPEAVVITAHEGTVWAPVGVSSICKLRLEVSCCSCRSGGAAESQK